MARGAVGQARKSVPNHKHNGGSGVEAIHRLIAGAGALAVLTTGASLVLGQSLDVTARAVWVISSLNPVVRMDDSSGPTSAMDVAIRQAASQETRGEMHIDRIDYVGRHDSGAHSAAYIFYVYFSDSSGLKFERFVRVLRTADGTLHVLAA